MPQDKGNNQKHQVKPTMQMKWLIFVGIILLIFSITGAVRNIIDHYRNQRQIMFEVVDLWGYRKPKGFYIDSEGNVYHFNLNQANGLLDIVHSWFFDYDREWPPYTTAELFRYYGYASKYSHTIPADELEYMFSLVDDVEAGDYFSYATQIHTNPPAGTQYSAFQYSRFNQLHIPIKIQNTGVYAGWIDAPEGEILGCWLEEVGYESSDCSFRKGIIDRYEEIKGWNDD